MYDRFTDRSRKVFQLANQEAREAGCEWVGTEHLLLGLLKEGNGVAANVLKNLGVNLAQLREAALARRVGAALPPAAVMGNLPKMPAVKAARDLAVREAETLNHNYVGTEHLLLGLLGGAEDPAVLILREAGVTAQMVRDETLRLLGHPAKAVPATMVKTRTFAPKPTFRCGKGHEWAGSNTFLYHSQGGVRTVNYCPHCYLDLIERECGPVNPVE